MLFEQKKNIFVGKNVIKIPFSRFTYLLTARPEGAYRKSKVVLNEKCFCIYTIFSTTIKE